MPETDAVTVDNVFGRYVISYPENLPEAVVHALVNKAEENGYRKTSQSVEGLRVVQVMEKKRYV